VSFPCHVPYNVVLCGAEFLCNHYHSVLLITVPSEKKTHIFRYSYLCNVSSVSQNHKATVVPTNSIQLGPHKTQYTLRLQVPCVPALLSNMSFSGEYYFGHGPTSAGFGVEWRHFQPQMALWTIPPSEMVVSQARPILSLSTCSHRFVHR